MSCMHCQTQTKQTCISMPASTQSTPGCSVATARLPGLGGTTPEEMLKYITCCLTLCMSVLLISWTPWKYPSYKLCSLDSTFPWSSDGFASAPCVESASVWLCKRLLASRRQSHDLHPDNFFKAAVRIFAVGVPLAGNTHTAKLNSNWSNLLVDLPWAIGWPRDRAEQTSSTSRPSVWWSPPTSKWRKQLSTLQLTNRSNRHDTNVCTVSVLSLCGKLYCLF